MSKPIYLLLKQHNVTKKYYLCKKTTSNILELFKYKGSGVYWNSHLSVHGCDISTVILEVAKTNEELKEKAKFYNKVWNIGRSTDLFLNLKPEDGDGGSCYDATFYETQEGIEFRKKMSKAQLDNYRSNLGIKRKKRLSESIKKYCRTDEGRRKKAECGLRHSKYLKEYFQTEKGRKQIELHKQKLREFYKTEEGKNISKELNKKRSITLQNFYKTDRGKLQKEKLSKIHKNYYQTDEGKMVSKNRATKIKLGLIEYYSTEEGKALKIYKSKKMKEFFLTDKGRKIASERNKHNKKACRVIINNVYIREYNSVADCLKDLKIEKNNLRDMKLGEIYTVKLRSKNTKHEFTQGTTMKFEWLFVNPVVQSTKDAIKERTGFDMQNIKAIA